MKRTAAIFAILALGAAMPGLAEAQVRARGAVDSLGSNWRPQQDEARRGVQQGRMVPLESIAPRLNRRAPGRLLDAGIESRGGLPVYRVRWQAQDGRRIDYLVDAATGMIIGADGE